MVEKFCKWMKFDRGIKKAANVAINEVLRVKEGERVLIITNPHRDGQIISQSLYDSAIRAGAESVIITQNVRSQLDFAEDTVINALKTEPDVAISISKQKLGKDKYALKNPIKSGKKRYDHIFNYLLGEKKMRSFWSPSTTIDMFRRTVPVDYQWIRTMAKDLKAILDKANAIRITNRSGCDVIIGIKGRKAMKDDGDFSKAGSGGNLPAGEVFISPAIANSEGVIVYDGCMSVANGVIIIREPITCQLDDGYISSIKGGSEARKLRKTIKDAVKMADEMAKDGKIPKTIAKEYKRNAYHLGELGIGLNPKARIIGNMLEDEKVLGTCHIAIGSNYDEDANTLIHLDGIINRPNIVAIMPGGKETEIMINGKFVI